MTATEHLEELCRRRGLSVYTDVRIRDRRPALVKRRQELAIELRLAGYSLPQIGKALGRDHSTILYLLKRAA